MSDYFHISAVVQQVKLQRVERHQYYKVSSSPYKDYWVPSRDFFNTVSSTAAATLSAPEFVSCKIGVPLSTLMSYPTFVRVDAVV